MILNSLSINNNDIKQKLCISGIFRVLLDLSIIYGFNDILNNLIYKIIEKCIDSYYE